MGTAKRFRVALSFPGERRAYVAAVADRLGERLGYERILGSPHDLDEAQGQFSKLVVPAK